MLSSGVFPAASQSFIVTSVTSVDTLKCWACHQFTMTIMFYLLLTNIEQSNINMWKMQHLLQLSLSEIFIKYNKIETLWAFHLTLQQTSQTDWDFLQQSKGNVVWKWLTEPFVHDDVVDVCLSAHLWHTDSELEWHWLQRTNQNTRWADELCQKKQLVLPASSSGKLDC